MEEETEAARRRSEIARAWAAHLTPDHGLPGHECERFCSFAGEMTHVPIGVDKDGNGPIGEHEPGYVETVCWCNRPGCRMYEADYGRHPDGQ